MKKFLFILSVLFLVFGFQVASSFSMSIELVTNGEFELPGVDANSWAALPQSSVPGWSSTSGAIEIWGANFVPDAPLNPLGSDGIAHGQHHEVTYNAATEYTTQDSSLLAADGFVDFSFDAWARYADGIFYSLTGSLSGSLAAGTQSLSGSDWANISFAGLSVLAGETLSLNFKSVGGGSSGAHIDQVSLQYTPVPEPATMFLIGTGLVGLAGLRVRKFRKK